MLKNRATMVPGPPGLTGDRPAPRPRQPVLPLLLERLTDEAPHKAWETETDRPDSRRALKQSVLANLQALLNCAHFACARDLAPWPHVSDSTLNYGMPPLAGKVLSDITWHEIERAIARAIARFEPRIIASELTIGCADEDLKLAARNKLSFDIQGRLWWSPEPLDFVFISRVDLESGHFELTDKD